MENIKNFIGCEVFEWKSLGNMALGMKLCIILFVLKDVVFLWKYVYDLQER